MNRSTQLIVRRKRIKCRNISRPRLRGRNWTFPEPTVPKIASCACVSMESVAGKLTLVKLGCGLESMYAFYKPELRWSYQKPVCLKEIRLSSQVMRQNNIAVLRVDCKPWAARLLLAPDPDAPALHTIARSLIGWIFASGIPGSGHKSSKLVGRTG